MSHLGLDECMAGRRAPARPKMIMLHAHLQHKFLILAVGWHAVLPPKQVSLNCCDSAPPSSRLEEIEAGVASATPLPQQPQPLHKNPGPRCHRRSIHHVCEVDLHRHVHRVRHLLRIPRR